MLHMRLEGPLETRLPFKNGGTPQPCEGVQDAAACPLPAGEHAGDACVGSLMRGRRHGSCGADAGVDHGATRQRRGCWSRGRCGAFLLIDPWSFAGTCGSQKMIGTGCSGRYETGGRQECCGADQDTGTHGQDHRGDGWCAERSRLEGTQEETEEYTLLDASTGSARWRLW